MFPDFEKCEIHKEKKAKFLCFKKQCTHQYKLLCKLCKKQNIHQDCLQSQKVMKIKQFINNTQNSLKPYVQMIEKSRQFQQLSYDLDLACAYIKKSMRIEAQGNFLLQRKIELFNLTQTNTNLQAILDDENFDENYVYQKQNTNLQKFEIMDQFDDLYKQLKVLTEKWDQEFKAYCQFLDEQKNKVPERIIIQKQFQQNQVEEPAQQESKKTAKISKCDQKKSSIITQQNILQKNEENQQQVQQKLFQFNSIQQQNEEINKLIQPQSFIFDKNSILQQSKNDSSISVSSQNNQKHLIRLEEYKISDQQINQMQLLGTNDVIVKTNHELIHCQIQNKPGINKVVFCDESQKIQSFQLIENNFIFFQTEDMNLQLYSIQSDSKTNLKIKVIQNLFSYYEKFQNLFILNAETKTIQKRRLKIDTTAFISDLNIQNYEKIIFLKAHKNGLFLGYSDGKIDSYDCDLNFLETKKQVQDDIIREIQMADNYYCLLSNKKLFLYLTFNQQLITIEQQHEIRHFSHCYFEQKITISCILEDGFLSLIQVGLDGNILHKMEKLKQLKDKKSTAFCFSTQKSLYPLQLYITSMGNLITYKVNLK